MEENSNFSFYTILVDMKKQLSSKLCSSARLWLICHCSNHVLTRMCVSFRLVTSRCHLHEQHEQSSCASKHVFTNIKFYFWYVTHLICHLELFKWGIYCYHQSYFGLNEVGNNYRFWRHNFISLVVHFLQSI